MPLDRRQFLYLLGATVGTATLAGFNPAAFAATGPYSLIALPYSYDALNNLNLAVAKYPELQKKTVVELIKNLDSLPADIRTTIRNNGGGDLNHTMFWQIMSPDGGGEAKGEIGTAIIAKFGSFEEFKNAFNQAGTKLFGSGWTWLVLNKSGQLEIIENLG